MGADDGRIEVEIFQVPLEEDVVAQRDALGQAIPRGLRGVAVPLRDRAAIPQVDDADGTRVLEQGQLHRNHPGGSGGGLERLERVFQVSRTVDAGDDRHPRDRGARDLVEGAPGAELDPVGGADHEDRRVGHRDREGGLVGEPIGAWDVDQLDTRVIPIEPRDAGLQGGVLAALFGEVIEQGRAVVDAARRAGRAGRGQQQLSERGFAGRAMADEGHVSHRGMARRTVWERGPLRSRHPVRTSSTARVPTGGPRGQPRVDR